MGRVITRCTQDMNNIDGPFNGFANAFLHITVSMISVLSSTVYMAGIPALVSGSLVGALGGWIGSVYLKAQVPIRREMSNAKSPIMSQVGAALAGLREFGVLRCVDND